MEEYRKKVYSALKGELGDSFTKTESEFDSLLDNDSEYAKKVYSALKGELGDSFDKTEDDFYSLVKKKEVGEKVSESLAEPITTGEKANLVSTPDQEFISQDEFERRNWFSPKAGDELSFKEKETPKKNYLNIFNQKDDYRVADASGSTVSMLSNVKENILQTQAPLDYLIDVADIKNRIDAIPKYFPEHAGQAEELKTLLANANPKNISEVRDAIDQIEKETFKPTVGLYGVAETPYQREVINNPTIRAAKRLREDTNKLRETFSQTGVRDGIVDSYLDISSNISKGSVEGLKDYVKGYTELRAELAKNEGVGKLTEKLQDGNTETLDSNDKLLLNVLAQNDAAHTTLDKKIPTSYKIGEAMGTSLGFMSEYILTAGLVEGIGAGVKATSKLGRIGMGATVKLAQAGVQTAAMPAMWQKTAINVSNGDNFGEALLNSYWDTAAENLSERIFMGNPIAGGAGKKTANILQRAGINFKADKGALGVFKNVLEESAEEKIGEIFTAPKDYDSFKEFWKGYTDLEQNKIMLGSVGLMVGAMGSATLAGNSIAKKQNDIRVKRLEKLVPSDIRSEIDVVFDSKDLTTEEQIDLINGILTDKLNSKEIEGDIPTVVGNAKKYAQYKLSQLTAESTDETAVVENGEMTIGEVEEAGNSQEKIDYLNEQGVKIPDGTTGEQLDKLYEEPKIESKQGGRETSKGSEKGTGKEAKAGKAEVEFKPFADVVLKSKTKKEAFDKVSKIKNVSAEVSDAFRKKYDPEEKLTPRQAFDKFYDEIKPTDTQIKPVEPLSPKKGVSVPTEGKVGEKGVKTRIAKPKIEEPDFSKKPLKVESGKSVISAGNVSASDVKSVVNGVIKKGLKDNKGNIQKAKQFPKEAADAMMRGLFGSSASVGSLSLKDQLDKINFRPDNYKYSKNDLNQAHYDGIKMLIDMGFETTDEVWSYFSKIGVVDRIKEKKQPVSEQGTTDGGDITSSPVSKSNVESGVKPIKTKQNEKEQAKGQGREEGLLAKNEKADKLLSEGLSDLADLVGAKISITGEQRVRVKNAIAKVAEGLILKGEVKLEQLAMAIKEYFSKSNIDISEELINETIKERGYAKGNESRKVLPEVEKDKGEGKRSSDMSGIDETKPENGKKAKKVSSSRFGVRYAFGDNYSEKGKQKYREENLYEYKPESQEEVVAIARAVVADNSVEDVADLFYGTKVPRRVRTAIGVLLADKYSEMAEESLSNGDEVAGDSFIDKESMVMETIQREIATESGRDISFFGSEFVMERLTPYKTARKVQLAMGKHAKEVKESKGYKTVKKIVEEELSGLRGEVLKEVGKNQRVKQAKEKAKKQVDTKRAKIQKDISDLTDMLRAASKKSLSSSIIGLNNDQIEIGGKLVLKYIELGIYDVKKLVVKLKNKFKEVGVDITDEQAKSMIPEIGGKSVDELEKEQILEQAAAQLAQEEFGVVRDKKTPKSDPIKQMVSTLVSKFRERAKAGDKAVPKSNMDIVKEAILNRSDYMDVWEQARQDAIALIDQMVAEEKLTESQADVYKKRVEDAYDKATTFSVSEKRVQQLIRESFKERDISIDDVVRDHYERKELHKKDLIDDLIQKSGLTEDAATELADAIDNAFNTLMIQKGEALLRKYVDTTVKGTIKKSAITKLNELVNLIDRSKFSSVIKESDLFNAIRESVNARNIDLNELVKKNGSEKLIEKARIISDILNKMELSEEDAAKLSDAIGSAFDSLMKKRGDSLVGKMINKRAKEKSTNPQKSPIAEIIELVNIGAIESPEFDNIFAEMYGVSELKEEDRQEIIKRGKKIQKIKSATVRHKEEQRLMSFILDLKGVNMAEVLTGFWYAHVLSGVTTHMRNVSDAYISSWIELMGLAGYNPTDIRRAIKAHKRGMKGEGRDRLVESFKTGYTPLSKKLEIPSILERIQALPKEDTAISRGVAWAANKYKDFFKHIPRLLIGTDSWIYAGAKEMASDLIVSREARKQLEILKGRKLTKDEKKALQEQIDKKLYIDDASMAAFRKQVDNESEDYKKIQEEFGEEPTGYSRREKNLRVYELIDQARGVDVTDKAFDIAGRAIGNINAYGIIGWAVDGLSRALRVLRVKISKPEVIIVKGKPVITFNKTKTVEIRPASLVIPFTRIVANVATRNIGWNPYVAIYRASVGSFGAILGKDSKYYVEMTPEEKSKAWQKVVKIAVIQSLLMALTAPGDDDDPVIRITLNGTGNTEKNKQLLASGWKPYSIQIGDWSFDYRILGGLSMILMPIGYVRDKQRFSDTEMNELELMATANFMAIGHILKTTPLYAINRMFEALGSFMSGDGEMGSKQATQILSSMGTGFVSPRVLKDIEDVFDLIVDSDAPRENAETVMARATQYLPFTDFTKGREMFDVFGRPIPVKFTTAQIIESVKQDEDVQYYLKQGYFRPAVSMRSTTFTLEDDRGNTVIRKLNTSDEREVEAFNQYEQAIGKLFRDAVMENKADGLEGEEFVSKMRRDWDRIQKDAKSEVYNWSENIPVKYDRKANVVE